MPVGSVGTEQRPFGIGINREGLVAGIQVNSELILTDKGIGVGSSRADVLIAYPGIEILASDHRFDVYVTQAEESWMRMSVLKGSWGDGPDPDTVYEMTASIAPREAYLPSYHPMGASCL